MTVAASAGYRKDYTGNGVTVNWPVPFYFLDASHLQVILTNISVTPNVSTSLTLNSDYTVDGAGTSSGGSITTASAYSSNYRITILRNVPLEQQAHYVEGDPFPASSHEVALDKLTMIVQQQAEALNRAVIGAAGSAATYTLPYPQAGMALGWVTAEKIGNVPNNAVDMAADLANTTDAAKGAGLVGYDSARTYGASTVGGALRDVLNGIPSTIVTQSATAFTTSGTAPNFTLTPTIPLGDYAMFQRFCVQFHANGTPTTNTLNVSGLGAKSLVQWSQIGFNPAVIVTGMVADVIYDGVRFIVMNPAIPRTIQAVNASVTGNALSVGLGPGVIEFRSSTLTNGVPYVSANPRLLLVVPSGATLGTVSGSPARLVLIAILYGGTVELAIVNLAGGLNLDETTLISTTAVSAGATAANVIYSKNARTNVPFRVVGFIDITEATAGTWATEPTLVQGAGGQALAALQSLGYGQTWQDVTASRAVNTTYTNTSDRLIFVQASGTSTTYDVPSMHGVVGGVSLPAHAGTGPGNEVSQQFVVPPGTTYKMATSPPVSFSLIKWVEFK